MKIRMVKRKNRHWKYYHVFTPEHVLEKVYCCIIDNTIWYNGKDGYFYNFIKVKTLDNQNHLIKESFNIETNRRTLEFVTDNMRTGFNLHGDPVCHRKNYYGTHRQALRGASVVNKRKRQKNGRY